MTKALLYANELVPNEQREFIGIRTHDSILSFRIQNGPIGEVGVNGVQITDVLRTVRDVYVSLNESFPCPENFETIKSIEDALAWQAKRTSDREERGVEGTSAA